MPLVTWKDEFSVGVPAFDADHKDLLCRATASW
jgi:hemerythrin